MTNPTTFKEVMGSFPTGVTVVTTMGSDGLPYGLTVNSFTSVSISPMLVLWCIDKKVSSYKEFINSKSFGIHILADDQQELCWAFAGKKDRFKSADWEISDRGLPIINGCTSVIECETYRLVDAGDHTILIGKVVNLEKFNKEPMFYFRKRIGMIPYNWNFNSAT
ncbi:flavin reductase family protein [Gracilibacillus dipsosauri]|uniref:flavin reductase family protein n=1 Tax=Gracilibacillus dipsosauri TaxID=178340 RepID=UPI002409D8CC